MSGGAIKGPYWVSTATNGTHRVCGRHAAVVASYRPDQLAIADKHCRRLQADHVAADRALHAAASDLVAALERAVAHFGPFADITINGEHDAEDVETVRVMRAALAKARGEA